MVPGLRGRRECTGCKGVIRNDENGSVAVDDVRDKCYPCLSLECRVLELESERKKLKRKVVECEKKVGEKEDVGVIEVNQVLKEETEKLLQNIGELGEENARLLEKRYEYMKSLQNLKQQEGLLKILK